MHILEYMHALHIAAAAAGRAAPAGRVLCRRARPSASRHLRLIIRLLLVPGVSQLQP